ncbi:OmpA/MotB family protein [Vibrio sp. MEBiC08052]|uniref:OmpA/MotB family protein n=1 Tax=Vibrio sp. MEBiC08052 TaxID=1761910 RepID=UPI0007407B8B|nr:OmpA family protein [Vibrio sp. MEBiC08052]KUI99563.1 chemotaxis protein MotB [Vibrio sp. MEBiC08052]
MKRGLTTHNKRYIDEENPYWVSFSDLMSGLLVIFILASVALIIELTQKTNQVDAGIDELKKAEQVRRNIVFDIKEELARRNVFVEIAENDTVIRIPDKTLSFVSGEDELPRNNEMQDAVREVGLVLHQAIMKEGRLKYLDTVFVEGHTDSDNIYYRGKGNWGLSVDRAISVWNIWQKDIEIEPKFGVLDNVYGQKLFSVSGYAATRRINTTEVDDSEKSQNRRIDIRFTVKRPTIADLERIVAQ